MTDPTKRFSSRVADYVRYRPDYPPAVLEVLQRHCGLQVEHVIADIGSGTGKLAQLFLRRGHRVYGVEPNAEMRAAAERLLAAYPHFVSIDGRAEAIPLPAASVDFVVAGQAYHWFDVAATQPEFARILRPEGWVALVWNERLSEGSTFAQDYERLLLEFATDYRQVNHKQIGDDDIRRQLGLASFGCEAFPHEQRFDYEGLRGRLLSSSYAPGAGHPRHEPMLAALRALFERNQSGGAVRFPYETKVYYGQMQTGAP